MTVLLRYYEGLSYDEIAGAMRCSKGTVASRLNRAHTQLALALDHRRHDRGA
jgi:DNA-directed RNA polymerase specialized sigma24 family protein